MSVAQVWFYPKFHYVPNPDAINLNDFPNSYAFQAAGGPGREGREWGDRQAGRQAAEGPGRGCKAGWAQEGWGGVGRGGDFPSSYAYLLCCVSVSRITITRSKQRATSPAATPAFCVAFQ